MVDPLKLLNGELTTPTLEQLDAAPQVGAGGLANPRMMWDLVVGIDGDDRFYIESSWEPFTITPPFILSPDFGVDDG